MISFGDKKPSNGPFISKVRRWVENALPAEHEDTVVMVNELQCFEPVRAPEPLSLCLCAGTGLGDLPARRWQHTGWLENVLAPQCRGSIPRWGLWQPRGRESSALTACHLPASCVGLCSD